MVTLPPVIYDLADPARNDFLVTNHFIGPFEYTTPSRQYVVLFSGNGVSTTSQVRVYKSLDGGLTWAIQDSANQPPDSSGYDVTQAGAVLHVVYSTESTGELRHITFDTATDTWGAITGGGPVIGGNPFHTTRASSGEITVVYQVGFGTPNHLNYVIFSGGVWGAATTFIPSPNGNSRMVLFNTQIDSGDLTHAYYTQDNRVLLGDKELHHRTLSLGGVVGAENIIDSALVDIDRITIGRCSQFTTLFVPVIYFLGSLPPLAKVWVSNGIGSTPTWTLEVVDTAPVVTAGGEDAELYSLVSNDTLTLYIFWIALDYTDPTNVIDRLYYASSTDGINWSLPILMYDAVTNPQLEDPTILDTNQDIHTLSISQLLDGTFGISTALEENGFCAGYALIDGASTCVITTIPATISGTVTLPPQPITQAHYSSPLIAFEFGGETFSYEITSPQQLPDGLHMQNNTGTQVSQTGPIVVNDGILIAGTPTYSEYQTPVVTTVAMQLRLTV